VLRTHTTAATVRALHADPNPPRRVFSVGPVFRRETIDYKHLPVFHQVDGIVIDANASFAMLLTLLTTFYRKMGFPRIQFRPAFFPYTEPSVEVFVYLESRQDWVEMGGAGVFRPEVTEPLGCTVPVLAWGLGLERVAMFRFGLSDIREIYLAHLDWLKETPLCRS
jgi:phenylalanyl-tRNA synthetase alpha chain